MADNAGQTAVANALASAAVTGAQSALYGTNGQPDWAQYLRDNPDVQNAYNSYLTLGLKASSQHMTPEAWAQQHYQNYGMVEGQIATLLTDNQAAVDKFISGLTDTTKQTLDGITTSNNDFKTQTTDAIKSLNQNSNDAITRMSAALQALRAPQARKQPNLIDLFRQNKARMGRGNGSTFLAGPNGTGLPGSNLPIGVNAISGVALSSPSLGA
jgi:predicted transcriptional regulator